MIDVTITLEELKRATAEVELAISKGYTHSVAVLTLISGGRSIDACVVQFEAILAKGRGGAFDLGRQYSAKNLSKLPDPPDMTPLVAPLNSENTVFTGQDPTLRTAFQAEATKTPK